MARSRFDRTTRPRSVWFALGTGLVMCIVVAGTVLLPILSLIGASAGAGWFVNIPFGKIWFVVIAGYLLAAGFLALILRLRRGPFAWIAAVAAIIATLIVSLYPAFAVAFVAVDRVGDVIPFIMDWINKGVEFVS